MWTYLLGGPPSTHYSVWWPQNAFIASQRPPKSQLSAQSRAAAQRSPTHVLCCLNRVSVSPQARSARGGRPVSTELQTQTADGPASSLRCGAGLETAPFQEAAIQGVEGSPS